MASAGFEPANLGTTEAATSDTLLDKHYDVDIGEEYQYCSSRLEHGISHKGRSYTVVGGIHSIQAGM